MPIDSVNEHIIHIASLNHRIPYLCMHDAYNRLMTICPGLSDWAGTRKVKPIWIYWSKRDSEWQWHLLGYMQICTSPQTVNHANTPPLSFLQAGCPSCCPTNSVKALKATFLTCYQFRRPFGHWRVGKHPCDRQQVCNQHCQCQRE